MSLPLRNHRTPVHVCVLLGVDRPRSFGVESRVTVHTGGHPSPSASALVGDDRPQVVPVRHVPTPEDRVPGRRAQDVPETRSNIILNPVGGGAPTLLRSPLPLVTTTGLLRRTFSHPSRRTLFSPVPQEVDLLDEKGSRRYHVGNRGSKSDNRGSLGDPSRPTRSFLSPESRPRVVRRRESGCGPYTRRVRTGNSRFQFQFQSDVCQPEPERPLGKSDRCPLYLRLLSRRQG